MCMSTSIRLILVSTYGDRARSPRIHKTIYRINEHTIIMRKEKWKNRRIQSVARSICCKKSHIVSPKSVASLKYSSTFSVVLSYWHKITLIQLKYIALILIVWNRTRFGCKILHVRNHDIYRTIRNRITFASKNWPGAHRILDIPNSYLFWIQILS